MVNINRRCFAKPLAIIPLVGGLGNQLFQLSFALWGEKVANLDFRLDACLANPRKINQNVALLSLQMRENSLHHKFLKQPFNTFLSKVYGKNLTRALRGVNSGSLMSFFWKTVSEFLFLFRYRRFLRLRASRDLGLDENLMIEENSLFIGYFQTYFYAEHAAVYKSLMTLEPKDKSIKYEWYSERILKEEPIMLHLRLTDYLKEDSFGLPGENYYKMALSEMRMASKSRPIWVFSDDTEGAKQYLGEVFASWNLCYFEDDSLSDAEVWCLMRKFSGYIIANSTFSWWAAFLREKRSAKVICPNPWFKGIEDPSQLIPRDWTRIQS